MRISKTYLSLIGASLIQGSAFAEVNMEGPLVQMNDKGNLVANPIFSPEIFNQIHHLIQRSYRITSRLGNPYNYRFPEKLTHQRSNSFSHPVAPDKGITEPHCDKWIIHAPFTGIHGVERLPGIVGAVVKIPFEVELDYAGFVSYLPREDERPPLIAVVFRGSQAQSFQPFDGIFGPSWLTNFSAAKGIFPEGIRESEGLAGACFHAGYLRKYLSLRINVLANIESMVRRIPEADRSNVRIIVTGHSQGAGVALPAALDITYVLGKRLFGSDFDNKVTPRFFAYPLSGPNSTGDVETKALMNRIIGRDNIIRHNSLFDIVTYACPGKHFDTAFCSAVFGTLAGAATGYHPVGHLAIDDMQSLIKRGFEYNDKSLSDELLGRIWHELSLGYSKAIMRRQLADSVLRPIRAFYLSVGECAHLLKGARIMDGLGFFACINHYGSITAKASCAPKSADDAFASVDHGSSFDPRLPETNLDSCLWRGQRNRELLFNQVGFLEPEQVFSRELSAAEVCVYGEGYVSDSEEI